jgi:acyl-CoA synthetase (AMP-forming)/AMP-acid ligase II
MWLVEAVTRSARERPDRVAVRDRDGSRTFRELDQRSASLAEALRDLGVVPGSRVAVVSANRTEVVETYVALARLGAAFVPLSPQAPASAARLVAGDTGVALWIGEEAPLRSARAGGGGVAAVSFESRWYTDAAAGPTLQHPPDVEMDALAAVFHTSATTGMPKGVPIDHRHLCTAALGLLAVTPVPDDAVLLACNPLYHGSMFLTLAFLSQGATVVLPGAFTPQSCLAALERERATHLWLVPEMLRFLLKARRLDRTDVSSLREVIYAAAPMPTELLRSARTRLGCDFRQVYGMTEALLIACLPPQDHDPSGSGPSDRALPVGRPAHGLAVEVRNDAGRRVPPEVTGQVCVRGDAVMTGYLGDPQATAEVKPDGWLLTGDRGRFDAHGYLHLEGRLKDLIIRGGQKIAPLEVERLLERHPAVSEAAVVGAPDPDWGQSPVAFVVPNQAGPLEPEDVLRFCVGRIEDYKRPLAVHVVATLPRNATGKLLRRELRPTPIAGTTALTGRSQVAAR